MTHSAEVVDGALQRQLVARDDQTGELTEVLSRSGSILMIPSSRQVTGEVPSGSGDTFLLAQTPIAGSLKLYINGLRQTPGVDYTVALNVVTTDTVYPALTSVLADYEY